MARMRGLYAKIAATTGKSYSEIRREAMRTVTAAAKKLIEEVLGPEAAKKPGEAWFAALKLVAPTFWEKVKTTFRIPSVEEVVSAVKSKYPDYATKIRAAYAPVSATVATAAVATA